jgi:hypothetical protein
MAVLNNRAFHALGDLGKTFEKEVGVPVNRLSPRLLSSFVEMLAGQWGKTD